MRTLAIDTIHSSTLLAQMSVDLSNPTEMKSCTTIKCRLSNLKVSDLEDPDLHIRVRHGIMKDVPRRKNKKRRIQKKWIKRYGMKQIVDYYETNYKVQTMEIDFKNDTVEFTCVAEDQLKRFSRTY